MCRIYLIVIVHGVAVLYKTLVRLIGNGRLGAAMVHSRYEIKGRNCGNVIRLSR